LPRHRTDALHPISRSKVVTKAPSASETPSRLQTLRAASGSKIGIRSRGLRVGQRLDVPGIGADRRANARRTLLTCSCQNRRAEVACVERSLALEHRCAYHAAIAHEHPVLSAKKLEQGVPNQKNLTILPSTFASLASSFSHSPKPAKTFPLYAARFRAGPLPSAHK